MLMQENSATLYVVATPIGNLADFSERARDTLNTVSLILAEDTRHSQKLCNHYGIKTPLKSLHEHNEQERVAEVIARLQKGDSLALISDAGTPLISDPGYRLVDAAHAAGIRVLAVPGPCAMTAALSVSGQATDRFVFEGYLPAKAAARRQRLDELAAETRTLVFYETPHRLAAMLEDMSACLGAERQATLAKELSKQFEQNVRGTLVELQAWLAADPKRAQGEFVIVVAGNPRPPAADDPRPLLKHLLQYVPVKTAAAIAADISSHSRNELYKLALELAKSDGD